jgi:nucleoside phosphorylase
MVAIAGRKGVSDRAAKLQTAGLAIVPVDTALGHDSSASERLRRDAERSPATSLPNLGPRALADLRRVTLDTSVAPIDAAHSATRLLSAEIREQRLAHPDVLVVTALPIELSALLTCFEMSKIDLPFTTADGTALYRVLRWYERSQRWVSISISCIGTAGTANASTLVSALLGSLKPRLVAMVGIAAGRRASTRLGDVVVADRVVTYEHAALVVTDGETGEQSRNDTFLLDHQLHQALIAHLQDSAEVATRLADCFSRHGVRRPADIDGSTGTHQVLPRFATLGSGDKLVRDAQFFDVLRNRVHGKIEVTEMEAAGVATACARTRTPLVVVRGISDHGDSQKDDRFHETAAFSAAAAVVDMIEAVT